MREATRLSLQVMSVAVPIIFVGGISLAPLFARVQFPRFRRLALGATRALGEFGATIAVAGSIPGRMQTMPLAQYDAMQRGDYDMGNSLSLIMVTLGFGTILFTRTFADRGDTR
jgi:ABC-type molybdate transport system permease subunit